MAVKRKSVEAAQAAIDRLAAGLPRKSVSRELTDRNLAIESGVSRATLARSNEVMSRWRQVKIESAKRELKELKQSDIDSVSLPFQYLLSRARLNAAAFHRMPADVVEEWDSIRSRGRKSLNQKTSRDQKSFDIDALLAKIYALTLALKDKDKLIEELMREHSS